MAKEFKKGKMVPVPSHSIVPERDVNKLPVLECQHLGIDFGGLTAVNEFNLTIGRTEIAGLIGPNGAGKTTVFNLLTKVYQPTRGTILLNGKDTHGMSTAQVNRAGIARTFQNIRLFSELSVLDNVKTGLHNQITYSFAESMFHLGSYRKKEKQMDEKAMELLSVFGLESVADYRAANLPYGKQRKLEIARALATEPKLLLLDEPAAGMNPQETLELAQFIREIREKHHLTVFLIEHHMELVMQISDYIYVIDFGSEIAQGTPKEVQNNQHVIDAYLGVVEDE